MHFLPLLSSRRRTMGGTKSYSSASSGVTTGSAGSSIFSSPTFQPIFCSTPRSPISSIESHSIEEDSFLLNCQQLSILRPPHQLSYSVKRHGGIPYSINSKVWYQENYNTVDHCGRGLCIALKRPEEIWDSVYETTGVVYGIAKVFIAVCRNFRIDLYTSTGNILACIEKAEQELEKGSVVNFVFATEDLYSSLYARLEIEIALLHFCSSFMDDGRKLKRKSSTSVAQPDPNHIYTILNVCKKILEGEGVCSAFDHRLVNYHKRHYANEMTRRYKVKGTLPIDPTGYRVHVSNTVKNPDSTAYRHWCQIYPELQHLSIDILAFLSEKYLAIYPCAAHRGNEYIFKTRNTSSSADRAAAEWDRNMICAHRLCSLAKIEGKAVGELRREKEAFSVIRYASEQKCICLDICSCSRLCTRSGSTLCPCSGRWVRGILTHQPESQISFRQKGTIMGELTYESLVALKRELSDDLVQRELIAGINIIREDMIKQRMRVPTRGKSKICTFLEHHQK